MRLTPEQQQMAEDNIGLAGFIAKKYMNRTPLDYEELFSICCEALCKAAMTYDPSSKWKFSTIACNTMKGHISNRLRDDKHLSDCYLEDINYRHPASVMPAVEEMVDMQNTIIKCLRKFRGSQREKAVVITFTRNPYLLQSEIASLAGVSQKTASTAIKRFREQLQEVV